MNKECAHCGMEIPQKANICPYCKRRQPQKPQKWEIILSAIIVWGGVIVAVMKCSDDEQKPTSAVVNQEYKTSHEELFKSLDSKMKSQQKDVKEKTTNTPSPTESKVDKETNTRPQTLHISTASTVEGAQQSSYTEEETETKNGFGTETQEESKIDYKEVDTNEDRKQQRSLRRAMKKQLKEMKKNNRN